MTAGVAITGIISRTVIELAFIGAALKLALAVAPRFQIAAPKNPPRPQPEREPAAEQAAAVEAALADAVIAGRREREAAQAAARGKL